MPAAMSSRNPLYDVELILQNLDSSALQINELEFKPYTVEDNNAQLDLSFGAVEHEKGIAVKVVYCSKLYKPETVERLAELFRQVLGHMTENRDVKLGDIPIDGLTGVFGQADGTVFDEEDSEFDF